jgi:hypothetical protein
MFGIDLRRPPGLRKIYLPADFEGHPLRKDFPLLARMVKPWPGIVDVEPMPGGRRRRGHGGGVVTAVTDRQKLAYIAARPPTRA